ncbi:SDR family NAD(P)-dependent oxidoreductase [Ruminococcus sp.]|uniref:SDR family NAD(P)-dependent oxidoreductase n=1 Tax=Ruminococcus sp. TaxID=41978 RepID=UPI002E7AADF0|nr:SDR family oxidoreductase [Ruminococcus sp.]MEE1262765.1 SDR family oxidoreductase [Ruminococcus sp.]
MILQDKIIVVTGGAQGIGKAIVEVLVQKGAYVVIADIDDKAGNQTIKEIVNCEFYHIDLCNDDEIEKMFAYVYEKFGRIDSLINDAGIQIRNWATDFDLNEFDKVINLNLRAYYVCSRTAARYMKEQHAGTIVCISSVNGTRYHSKRSAYNISKAGVNGLVGTLAVELGRFGIRINSVAPGYVETEVMLSGFREGILNEKNIKSVIPMKKYVLPCEVGKLVAFLASEESSGITGQTIHIDNGQSKIALPEEEYMD